VAGRAHPPEETRGGVGNANVPSGRTGRRRGHFADSAVTSACKWTLQGLVGKISGVTFAKVDTVHNTYEDINTGSGTEGNGVDLADLKNPEYLPVPVGTPVWLREAVTGAGGTEMLFHFTNEILGDDNRSSSSSSSSSA